MDSTIETRKQIFANDMKSLEKDQKGRLIFEARSLNNDFLPKEWLEVIAEDSPGKTVLYRHRHPASEEHADEPIYGRVLSSRVVNEDGKNWVISKYMLYNTTNRHRTLIEAIEKRMQEKRNMGISMAYHVYSVKNEGKSEIVGVHVLEHSVTWKPRCPLCVILEDGIMEDKKEDKPAEKTSDEILSQLDDKAIRLEALEADLQQKKEELEKVKRESEERAKNIELQKKMLDSLAQKVAALEEHNKYLEKKPLIDEIIKLEPADDVLTDFYAKQDVKFLEDRIARLKARPAPVAKQMETAQQTQKNEETKINTDSLKKWALEQGFTEEEIKKVFG